VHMCGDMLKFPVSTAGFMRLLLIGARKPRQKGIRGDSKSLELLYISPDNVLPASPQPQKLANVSQCFLDAPMVFGLRPLCVLVFT
jgi:hypothetical protein